MNFLFILVSVFIGVFGIQRRGFQWIK